MPIYEYQCEKCQHHLEALQKIADKPLRECPECGRHSLKRLVSAPLFRLAGSGWYETDFKSEKETKRNLAGRDESPAEPAKESGGESSAKTEATPEPKPKPEAKPAPETRSPRKTVAPRAASRPSTSRSKPKLPAPRPKAKKSVRKP